MSSDRHASHLSAVQTARHLSDSAPLDWVARAGLGARSVIYLTMGLLALVLAQGKRAEVDQRGALTQLAQQPFGTLLVVVLCIGFACYAVWRLSEAAFGAVGEGAKKAPRAQSLVRGIAYAILAISALSLLLGSRTSQGSQQRTITARVMDQAGGKALIFTIGVSIVLVGLFLAWEGVTRRFMKYFPQESTPDGVLRAITGFGTVGNTVRGLVFTLAGLLVMMAAWQHAPEKASGLDGALKTLRDGPAGFLLVVAALGLIAFGVYAALEAVYRRV